MLPPPTDTVYSLSKDEGFGPENASSDRGARAFIPRPSRNKETTC
jgi:hypothetical protein